MGFKAGFAIEKVSLSFLVQRRKHQKRKGKKENELLCLNLQMKGVNLTGTVKIVKVYSNNCIMSSPLFEKESVGYLCPQDTYVYMVLHWIVIYLGDNALLSTF